MLQLVQRVSCAATSRLSMWLCGCCLLVAQQEEAALEKTPAKAGRALWCVLRASTAKMLAVANFGGDARTGGAFFRS